MKMAYVIGRMRNFEKYNHAAFMHARKELESRGWNVIDPHAEDLKHGFDVMAYEPSRHGLTWADYPPKELFDLSACNKRCAEVVSLADAIFVLKGGLGEGGLREILLAQKLGKAVHYEQDGYPKAPVKRVIGVTGKAGSGKDTVAGMIHELTCGRSEKIPFAKPMKDIARLFGFTYTQLYDPVEKEKVDPFWEISPRRFLQILGTEMFRGLFRDDVWLKMAERAIASSPQDVIVISDVRFENEAAWLRAQGGTLVHVVGRATTTGETAHSSEAGVQICEGDVILPNTGTLEQLREMVKGGLGL